MSIPVIDTAEARRRIMGLVDPDARPSGPADAQAVKDAAQSLCVLLARHFGRDLDRMTLWDRIASALEQASAKCDDGDLPRLASLALAHVSADAAGVARDDQFGAWLATVDSWPPEVRQAFVRRLTVLRYAVIAEGRQRWESLKEMGEAFRG